MIVRARRTEPPARDEGAKQSLDSVVVDFAVDARRYGERARVEQVSQFDQESVEFYVAYRGVVLPYNLAQRAPEGIRCLGERRNLSAAFASAKDAQRAQVQVAV